MDPDHDIFTNGDPPAWTVQYIGILGNVRKAWLPIRSYQVRSRYHFRRFSSTLNSSEWLKMTARQRLTWWGLTGFLPLTIANKSSLRGVCESEKDEGYSSATFAPMWESQSCEKISVIWLPESHTGRRCEIHTTQYAEQRILMISNSNKHWECFPEYSMNVHSWW